MNERLKELAAKAGFNLSVDYHCDEHELEQFANFVAADEREACARLCESMGVHPALNVWGGGPEWYQRQKKCATAIRARGEK